MSTKENNEVAVEKVTENDKASADAKCDIKGIKRPAEVSTYYYRFHDSIMPDAIISRASRFFIRNLFIVDRCRSRDLNRRSYRADKHEACSLWKRATPSGGATLIGITTRSEIVRRSWPYDDHRYWIFPACLTVHYGSS